MQRQSNYSTARVNSSKKWKQSREMNGETYVVPKSIPMTMISSSSSNDDASLGNLGLLAKPAVNMLRISDGHRERGLEDCVDDGEDIVDKKFEEEPLTNLKIEQRVQLRSDQTKSF
jgi:hypothetical protein